MREGTLYELLDRVHAAPLEEGGWERALDAMRDVFEAAWAHVMLVDPTSLQAPFRVMRCPDPVRAAEYLRSWYAEDPWAGPTMAQSEGSVGTSESILAPEALHRTRFYREWLAPQGLEGGMGAVLERKPEGRVAALTLLRRPGRAPYGEPELALLRQLVAPVRRALQVEERLRELSVRRAICEGFFERLGMAAFLVEDDGRIAWQNETGRAFLARGDVLRNRDGRLDAGPEAARAALREALAAATRTEAPSGGLVRVQPGAGAVTTVSVWPVPCERAWQGAGCAVAVVKPEEGRRALSEEMVASVYGLTAAEAAVAVALARGDDVREIAHHRRVSPETVRGQLKAVLAKTGCSRQADLVRMLLAGPAGWPDPRT